LLWHVDFAHPLSLFCGCRYIGSLTMTTKCVVCETCQDNDLMLGTTRSTHDIVISPSNKSSSARVSKQVKCKFIQNSFCRQYFAKSSQPTFEHNTEQSCSQQCRALKKLEKRQKVVIFRKTAANFRQLFKNSILSSNPPKRVRLSAFNLKKKILNA